MRARCLLCLLCLLFLPSFAPAAPRYVVTELPLPTSAYAEVFGVNDHGQVVGTISYFANARALPVTWEAGALRLLPTLSEGGTAFAINEAGVIVGWSTDRETQYAARWREGVLQRLTLVNNSLARALAIDAAGEIVGAVRTGTFEDSALLWNLGGVYSHLYLPSVPPSAYSFVAAMGISREGMIVITWDTPGRRTALRGKRGQVVPLPHLPGFSTGNSTVSAISDNGIAVGSSDGFYVRWLPGASPPEILSVPSPPVAVNNRSEIVGIAREGPNTAYGAPGTGFAWHWSPTDGFAPLTTLLTVPGVRVVQAGGINNLGQIAAIVYRPGGGGYHPALLTPVTGPVRYVPPSGGR